ncbi:hypothetical protein F4823DRAFT_618876 [Ustulina deusta]|nr:hypothetical protein F4823DRAFT_618876 [Ustulina deusta]
MAMPIPEDTLPIPDDTPSSPQTSAPQESIADGMSKGKGQAQESSDDEAPLPGAFEVPESDFSGEQVLLLDFPPGVYQPNLTCQCKAPRQKQPSKPELKGWARLFRYDPFLCLLLSTLQEAGIEIPGPDGILEECIGFEVDWARLVYQPAHWRLPSPDQANKNLARHMDKRKKDDTAVQSHSPATFLDWSGGEGTAERSSSHYTNFKRGMNAGEHARDSEGLTLRNDSGMVAEIKDYPDALELLAGPISKTEEDNSSDMVLDSGLVICGPI